MPEVFHLIKFNHNGDYLARKQNGVIDRLDRLLKFPPALAPFVLR